MAQRDDVDVMHAAVDLDDQAGTMTEEIDDVWPHGACRRK